MITLELKNEPEYLSARLKFRGWTVVPSGCWEFKGSGHKQGYGQLKIDGRTRFAHRVAYTAWVGPIPDNLLVRHSCDNPPCINPRHLLVGTQKDNMHDRDDRNRRRAPAGELNAQAKLTNQSVLFIRAQLEQGVTRRELATQFGVHLDTIHLIAHRKTWMNI